jgi:hypothetical protein
VKIMCGGSSRLGIGRGADKSLLQNNGLLRNVTQDLVLASPCVHGNEPSGSIKGGEFLD